MINIFKANKLRLINEKYVIDRKSWQIVPKCIMNYIYILLSFDVLYLFIAIKPPTLLKEKKIERNSYPATNMQIVYRWMLF
jgi:hypothetical protein